MVKLTIGYKIWLKRGGTELIGPGGIALLKAITREGSLKSAAESLGMSYVFAWRYLRKLEKCLGKPIVETRRGGKRRGATTLTAHGLKLLEIYEKAWTEFEKLSRELKFEI